MPFDMAGKLLETSDYPMVHDKFQIWLRTVADFLQSLVQNSGIATEWLSLPVITFYINGGGDAIDELIKCIDERLNWLSSILNVEYQVDLSGNNKIHGVDIGPLFGNIKTIAGTEKPVIPERNIHEVLKTKEWLNDQQRSRLFEKNV